MPSLHDFPRRESHDTYRQTIRSHGGKEQRVAFKSLDFYCRCYHFVAATILIESVYCLIYLVVYEE